MPDRPNRTHNGPRRWPLILIASPAAVSIWSGWVALGTLCGFGLVTPLPGIADSFRINTAITLPIGVEAYGAYALGVWVAPGMPERARAFARRSAIGALTLGMAGQVIYHLLAAAHAPRAPWPVTVVVACMPVITLGFGTALTHLLRDRDGTPGDEPREENQPGIGRVAYPAEPWPRPSGLPAPAPVLPAAAPEPKPLPRAPGNRTPSAHPGAPAGAPDGATGDRTATRTRTRTRTRTAARTRARTPGVVSADAAEVHFAAVLAEGRHPPMRRVKAELRTGQDRATQIHDQLAAVAPEPDGHTCRRAASGRPA